MTTDELVKLCEPLVGRPFPTICPEIESALWWCDAAAKLAKKNARLENIQINAIDLLDGNEDCSIVEEPRDELYRKLMEHLEVYHLLQTKCDQLAEQLNMIGINDKLHWRTWREEAERLSAAEIRERRRADELAERLQAAEADLNDHKASRAMLSADLVALGKGLEVKTMLAEAVRCKLAAAQKLADAVTAVQPLVKHVANITGFFAAKGSTGKSGPVSETASAARSDGLLAIDAAIAAWETATKGQ